MSTTELRDELQQRLVGFLWSQWGQMGVAADPGRRDTWAADPEALLLLTFEVGDYMFSSRTRTLVEEIEQDLLFAGIRVGTGGSTEDLPSFERFVLGLTKGLV